MLPVRINEHPLGDVAAAWDNLATELRSPPFLRPGWMDAWSRAFARREMTVFTATVGGEPVGIWPAIARRGALVSPTNWHTPWFSPISRDPTALRALVDNLVRRGNARVDVNFVRDDDPVRELLVDASPAARRRARERVVRRSPYVPIRGSWESYEASQLPAKRRKELSRQWRRLSELGETEFEVSDGSERLDLLLREIFTVEAAGWKGARRTAMQSRLETKWFYETIVKWAAAHGWLQLWSLRLDRRMLAFELCLIHGGAQYALKAGFDPEYARVAPGLLLTRELLRRSFGTETRSYELLGGAELYKLEWTRHWHDLVRVQLFAPGGRGAISRVAWDHGRPLVKALLRARQLGRGGAAGRR